MGVNLATAYNNLHVLLDAGVPLLRSLDNIIEGTQGHIRRAFQFLKTNAAQGNPLAKSMAEYPRVFGYMDIVVIEAAETSGSLPEALKLLADWHQFCKRMKGIIGSGMVLPILILHFGAFLIPLPTVLLSDAGWSTRTFLSAAFSVLLPFYIVAAVIISIIKFMPERGVLRRVFDGIVLRIPLIGQAVRHLAIARYCRAFHMMFKAGVPIIESLEKSESVTGNVVISSQLAGGTEAAKQGGDVSQGFSKRLPRDFLELWRTGEEAGSLDTITKKLGDNHSFTAELLLKNIAMWTPRIVYAFIAIRMIVAILGYYSSMYGSVMNL